MPNITVTYTTDFTFHIFVDENELPQVTPELEERNFKAMGVSDAHVRNFKVFVHEDRGEREDV